MFIRKSLASMAMGALFATGAQAADSGFYLGAGVGQASQRNFALDDSDVTYRGLAGYSINRYFAFEGGFIDTGTQQDNFQGLDLKVSSNGFFAAALAKLPLGEVFAPYAKVGYALYDTRSAISSGAVSVSASESAQDPMYGFGVELKLGEHFRLRAEYDYVDVPNVDFDILTLVAAWQF